MLKRACLLIIPALVALAALSATSETPAQQPKGPLIDLTRRDSDKPLTIPVFGPVIHVEQDLKDPFTFHVSASNLTPNQVVMIALVDARPIWEIPSMPGRKFPRGEVSQMEGSAEEQKVNGVLRNGVQKADGNGTLKGGPGNGLVKWHYTDNPPPTLTFTVTEIRTNAQGMKEYVSKNPFTLKLR
jgi:hypothetical protein